MRYVECPEPPPRSSAKSVFLAGGITGCEDWQSQLVEKLSDCDMVLLNPRRRSFDVTNPNGAEEQITWEFNALQSANLVSFWFAADQVQPIALYELGRWLALEKHQDWFWTPDRPSSTAPVGPVIGCDPRYPRRQDVIVQTRLARPDIQVVDTLDALGGKIRSALRL